MPLMTAATARASVLAALLALPRPLWMPCAMLLAYSAPVILPAPVFSTLSAAFAPARANTCAPLTSCPCFALTPAPMASAQSPPVLVPASTDRITVTASHNPCAAFPLIVAASAASMVNPCTMPPIASSPMP